MSVIRTAPEETVLVTIRIKKHELAECLRRIRPDGTLHDALYYAFSFGQFAAYKLASENRQLLQRLVDDWRSPYRRPNDARLMGRTDEELVDEYFGVATATEDRHRFVSEALSSPKRPRTHENQRSHLRAKARRETADAMSVVHDPSGERILVSFHIKRSELADCLRRMPSHRSIHDGLYNAFSFGLFAAYELESEDEELLQKLLAEWRSPSPRPNHARLVGKTDDELLDEFLA